MSGVEGARDSRHEESKGCQELLYREWAEDYNVCSEVSERSRRTCRIL